MSSLDGKNDLLGFAVSLVFVVEVETSINAAVRAFLLFRGPRTGEAERPPLKLIRVIGGEILSARQVDRLSDDLVGIAYRLAERVGQTLLFSHTRP